MKRLWTLLSIFALLLGIIAVPAIAADGTVAWTGQGASSSDCEDYEEGTVHWIFQGGPGARLTSVTLHVPGEEAEEMTAGGGNTWHGYTGFGDGVVDESGTLSFEGDQPYVEYTGRLGRNARLLVSGFCYEVPPTGSILISKTYTVDPGEERAEFQVWTAVSGPTEAIAGEYLMDMTAFPGDPDLYCADGLPFGNYMVVESSVPTGFEPAGDVFQTVGGEEFPDTEKTCAERLGAVEIEVDIEFTNEASPIEVVVQKLKLTYLDGVFVPSDTPLAGFAFTLYDANADAEEVGGLASGVSGADGIVRWGGDPAADSVTVEVPGSYYVCEESTPQPGYWTDGGCQYFDAELDTDVLLTFYNAPRADVSIGFTDVTGYTSAEFACYDSDGVLIDGISLSGTGQLDLSALDLGDYTCDVLIRNGETLD